MRIALNNGAGGTFTALRMTTTSSFRVLSLGTGASNGTGLRGNSSATATNFVVAYDNVAGTGLPISATDVAVPYTPLTPPTKNHVEITEDA